MGLHKTEKPMFPKEFIWPTKMIHIATDTLRPLTALSQYAAQATSDPSVECRKRPLIAVFEILKPALKRAIHVRRDIGQTLAVATPGMGTNGVFEFPQTFLAGPPCATFEVIAEKVKSLTRKCCIYHAGLLGMQYKTSFRDQLLHLVQGLACLCFVTAHNDKIIGISDHLKICRLHRLINGMEVKVGQQGADDGSLRGSLLGSPSGQSFKDVLTKKLFDQGKQSSVGNMPANFSHQSLVGYAVKVCLQIRIHHAGIPGLQAPVYLSQGVLASSVWPETVALWSESRLEYRLYNQPHRRLDYPIPHGRYPQRPLLFTAKLVYIDPLDRSRSVFPGAKRFFQSGNVLIKITTKSLHAFMIRPGTASVPSDCLPGSVKGRRPVHFIDQAEPHISFHPLSEGLQHAIGPYGMFHPVVRPSFSRLFSPDGSGHCHGGSFILYRHRTSTFLRPFAPRPLRRFFTNMDALTPDRRALRTLIRGNELPACPDQVSLVHMARPSIHSVTKHLARPVIAFMLPTQRDRLPDSNSPGLDFTLNPQARRGARPNRVRHPTDYMFASGCSPPRLATTQLPSATGSGHLPREDFHLSDRACSQAHGFPPARE